jgi:ATP-binding cassette subfamily B protein
VTACSPPRRQDAVFINRTMRSADRRILGAESSLQVLASVVSAAGLIWAVREAATGKLAIGDVALFLAPNGCGGAPTPMAARE